MNIKNKSAFSLLEMSIVLVVISVALGGGLGIINKYSGLTKREQNDEKMQYVMTAIKNYAQKNGSLPCPADPTLSFSDSGVGASGAVTNQDGSVACYSNGAQIGDATVSYGMLPFVALGLYPSYAIDEWGNRYKYVIFTQFAGVNGLNKNQLSADNFVSNLKQ